jgi:hypothetical protein
MADFARILAAIDRVAGTDALPRYLAQRGRIVADVIDADPVGAAILALADAEPTWTGTNAELLDRIRPERAGREWPGTPRGLSARIKRLRPALGAAGLRIDQWREKSAKRERRVRIQKEAEPTVQTVRTRPEDDAASPVKDASDDSDVQVGNHLFDDGASQAAGCLIGELPPDAVRFANCPEAEGAADDGWVEI